MAILVTDDGNVKNQIYTLPHHTNGEEIEKAVRLINDQLVGKPLSSVNEVLLKRIADHLVAGGSATEINYESDDLAKVKSLYKLIDQNDAISSLIGFNPKDEIKNDSKSKVQVKLGSELQSDLLEDYSLLTAQYSVGKYGKGTIALLGPTNMPYSQMIGLLEYFRNELAKKLLDYYGRFK